MKDGSQKADMYIIQDTFGTLTHLSALIRQFPHNLFVYF